MQKEGGRVSEMTPSALYELFVEIARVKLHLLVSYNHDDDEAKRMIRMHKSITNESTHINLKVRLKIN